MAESAALMPTPGAVTTEERYGRVIYLGGYVDEAIVRERRLPAPNAAGSNRMMRIAQAIAAAGFRPVILSPGTSLRARPRGQFVYPQRIHRTGRAQAVFATMLNVPGLNVVATTFTQFVALRGLLRKGDVAAAVVYNYNLSLVILAAYLKYIWRLPLVQNVEDIAEPKLRDWLPGGQARPVQQLVYWVCQHAIARMAGAYLVPTRRFLDHLPEKSAVALVTGCIAIEYPPPQRTAPPLRILFAGKIEREHGVHALVEALKLLDARTPPPAIEVDVTGGGDMAEWVRGEFANLTSIPARFHGFVPGAHYRELLSAAQVCVALQDPQGRHASFKTPSKVYEFVGYGKAVIATGVGDIGELDGDVLIALPTLDAPALAAALDRLAGDADEMLSMCRRARAHAEAHFAYAAVGKALVALVHKCRQKGQC